MINVVGQNFGAGATLQFSCANDETNGRSCSGSDLWVPSGVYQSQTSINVNATVQAGTNAAGNYNVRVVSGGSLGLGFQAGGTQNNPNSDPQRAVTVTSVSCISAQIIEETVSPGSLPVRNPATIRQGYAPVFEVTTSPPNCFVQWSVTGSGSIPGSSTTTLVTVNGNSTGSVNLQAASAGGLISSITVPVKQQQTFSIRAMIVRHSDGTGASVGVADVVADIANANLVWQQAGVQFNLVSTGFVDNDAYFIVTGAAQRVSLANTLQNTGGFEVYYVPTCTDNPLAETETGGIVVCVNNSLNNFGTATVPSPYNTTLAHELGHAGGLQHASADPPAAAYINLMYPSARSHSRLTSPSVKSTY